MLNIESKEAILITPLRKINSKGNAYIRHKNIDKKLSELVCLPITEIVEFSKIRSQNDANYIPSECLLYFVRNFRNKEPNNNFNKLYSILFERVINLLPKESIESINFNGLTKLYVLDRFKELLASDYKIYNYTLDYYEVRFNDALNSLKIDMQRKVKSELSKRDLLESDFDSPKIQKNIEEIFLNSHLTLEQEFEEKDFRFRLSDSINKLPILQQRIIPMWLDDIPIYSEDSSIRTISKELEKSEKTIRNHRDKAIKTLREILIMGEN